MLAFRSCVAALDVAAVFSQRSFWNVKRNGKTVWPSGLRRWLKAPFRKGVGSNPTAVIFDAGLFREATLFGSNSSVCTSLLLRTRARVRNDIG